MQGECSAQRHTCRWQLDRSLVSLSSRESDELLSPALWSPPAGSLGGTCTPNDVPHAQHHNGVNTGAGSSTMLCMMRPPPRRCSEESENLLIKHSINGTAAPTATRWCVRRSRGWTWTACDRCWAPPLRLEHYRPNTTVGYEVAGSH